MSIDTLWKRYAATWSMTPNERVTELRECVNTAVVYLDPESAQIGLDQLATYMEGFRSAMPGAWFEIYSVVHHHDRSLVLWRLRDASGRIAQTGASCATHDARGRLETITGFFDVLPGLDTAMPTSQ